MCGIAGIIELKEKAADGSLVRKMTDAIAHRGPDTDFSSKDAPGWDIAGFLSSTFRPAPTSLS